MTNMSDPARTLAIMTVNPWQRLAEDWPQIQVVYSDFAIPTQWGESRWHDGRPVGIVLNKHLNQVERRCVLAHELEHLDRGAPHETLRPHIERRVLKATAAYLLPDLTVLADALAAATLREAAEDLWVTWSVLIERLRGLSDAELDFVAARRETIA